MSEIRFEPPFDAYSLAIIAALMLAVALVLKIMFPAVASPARRRPLLIVLRSLTLGLLIWILAGPTWVSEHPGESQHREIFCLLDSSQSMDIGKSHSRWDDAVKQMAEAHQGLSDVEKQSLRYFRFGHRLHAVPAIDDFKLIQPQDSDSRLAEALRLMTNRFGPRPPTDVVLFSDGQVRTPEQVRDFAKLYAARKIPIHVFPSQVTTDQGDIAIIAAISPAKVRKFADVEVQVFLRSVGFTDQRAEVSLIVPETDRAPEEILSRLPVTLRGGVQAVPLRYRSDATGRNFEVRVTPLPNEISDRNNTLSVSVQIERAKIRVLYIDGNQALAEQLREQGITNYSVMPKSPLQILLTQDPDVECLMLISSPTTGLQTPGSTSISTIMNFPADHTEMSAFDCVILNNIPADRFSTDELSRLKDWVEKRGGGLIVCGGPNSFSPGGWDTTVLPEMLPVTFVDSKWNDQAPAEFPVSAVVDQGIHPIWQIVLEHDVNLRVLEQLPKMPGMVSGLMPKVGAEILAVSRPSENTESTAVVTNSPVMVAGQDGRGRVLVMGWDIGSPAGNSHEGAWGQFGSANAEKFWKNIVYWMSENSSIGRRRVVGSVDKQFFQPGESIQLKANAFTSLAQPSTDFQLWAVIEPQSFEAIGNDMYTPVEWPAAIPRPSGETIPRIIWGEEFRIPATPDSDTYTLPLKLIDQLGDGLSDQNFRIQLTAYDKGENSLSERGTQIDSTTIDVQVVDDPFESQEISINTGLLQDITQITGGKVLSSVEDLATLLKNQNIEIGASTIHRTPAWPQWWLLLTIGCLLTTEWIYRRLIGMA